jgi:hypothetical protein
MPVSLFGVVFSDGSERNARPAAPLGASVMVASSVAGLRGGSLFGIRGHRL